MPTTGLGDWLPGCSFGTPRQWHLRVTVATFIECPVLGVSLNLYNNLTTGASYPHFAGREIADTKCWTNSPNITLPISGSNRTTGSRSAVKASLRPLLAETAHGGGGWAPYPSPSFIQGDHGPVTTPPQPSVTSVNARMTIIAILITSRQSWGVADCHGACGNM